MIKPWEYFAVPIAQVDLTDKYFKIPSNTSCIDLILAKRSRLFQSKCVTETELSYFWGMKISVLHYTFGSCQQKLLIAEILRKMIIKNLWLFLQLARNS